MSSPTRSHPPQPRPATRRRFAPATPIARIAVGVDGFSEGEDATALGAAIARVTGAELMLVTVHPDPLLLLPGLAGVKSLGDEADGIVRSVRDRLAPGARLRVETDLSVPRALSRVVRQAHRDLLIVGSSRHADPGRVQIGKRTRQLLGEFSCPLAVAPRGYQDGTAPALRRIGAGYDGSPESGAAVSLAASLAKAAGAELHIDAVVDDRFPPIGFTTPAWGGGLLTAWQEAVDAQTASLSDGLHQCSTGTGVKTVARLANGRPADALLKLAENVDLLVIGSRRWGPAARVLLGSTGEALLHGAACAVLTVPRPRIGRPPDASR